MYMAKNPQATYATDTAGTKTEDAAAVRLSPPDMIRYVISARAIPTITSLEPVRAQMLPVKALHCVIEPTLAKEAAESKAYMTAGALPRAFSI
jgi:hypothetical protein